MNKYFWPFDSYNPTGRDEALKIARHHAKYEHKSNESPEYCRTVNEYMLAIDRARRALVHLGATTDVQRLEKLSYRIFQDWNCRLTAVLFAGYYKRSEEDRGTADGLTRAQAHEWARRCQQLAKQDEPYRLVVVRKNNKAARPSWKFGIVRYSQQLLASWIMLAQRELPGYDFYIPNGKPKFGRRGGHHKAAQQIGKALENDYRFWAVSDLKNAYSSMGRPIVKQLFTMDKRLLRYVVCPTLRCPPCTGRSKANAIASQPQLPQGSAHAWIILSALIGEVLQKSILKGTPLWFIVYADNVAIGAQDILSANGALRTFEAELFAQPRQCGQAAGKLTLHEMMLCDGYNRREYGARTTIEGTPLHNSVDFCGYRIRRDLLDDTVHYSPSAEAWIRFWSKVTEEFTKLASDYEDFDEFLSLTMRRFDKWANQFPLWARPDRARDLVQVSAVEKHDQILQRQFHQRPKTGR